MSQRKHSALSAAIADWSARHIIDEGTAARLRDDLGPAPKGWSFGNFLIVAGVLALIAAVFSFVSANWDEMSKLSRLILLMGTLIALWGGAIWSGLRGHTYWREGFILLACAMFGANIMLVAQIYHMQGLAEDAVFLWLIGTVIAGALTRSSFAATGGLVLLYVWAIFASANASQRFAIDFGLTITELVIFAVGVAILVAIGIWSKSKLIWHLVPFSLFVVFAISRTLRPMRVDFDDLVKTMIAEFFVICLLGIILNLALSYNSLKWRLAGRTMAAYLVIFSVMCIEFVRLPIAFGPFGRNWPFSILELSVLVLVVAAAAYFNWSKSKARYDILIIAGLAMLFAIFQLGFIERPNLIHTIIFSALSLGMTVWAIRLAWRHDLRVLRWFGMFWFVVVILSIYGTTIGTLLDAAMFFLGAGVTLLVSAFVSTRIKSEAIS